MKLLSRSVCLGNRNTTIYNIIRWFAGTNWLVNQASDVPSIIFFFMISCKILCKNGFNVFFNFFYEFTKIKTKSFECPKSIRNYEKNKSWNIRCLFDESFVPVTQRTSVLYFRLSDFRSSCIRPVDNTP